jgi:2-methylisocitrate lyase-like PEP mutase family enzyme
VLEDQLAPKRCGHTPGKEVVSREEAVRRIRAAVDARNKYHLDIVILARTDARIISLEEAIYRCQLFREAGADWTFLEAPRTIHEMEEYCRSVSGPKLANMLEYGDTPILTPQQLESMGYTIAAYPLTLLSASVKAMQRSLELLKLGKSTESEILSFEDLKAAVGFPEYYALLKQYQNSPNDQ